MFKRTESKPSLCGFLERKKLLYPKPCRFFQFWSHFVGSAISWASAEFSMLDSVYSCLLKGHENVTTLLSYVKINYDEDSIEHVRHIISQTHLSWSKSFWIRYYDNRLTMVGSPEQLTKNPKWLGLCLAFVCLNISVALFVAIAIFRKEACLDCKQFSPILLPMLIILATLLLFLAVSILMSLCLRRTRSLTRTPQVLISSIPAGDLEKSPTAILPYNHGEPFVECS